MLLNKGGGQEGRTWGCLVTRNEEWPDVEAGCVDLGRDQAGVVVPRGRRAAEARRGDRDLYRERRRGFCVAARCRVCVSTLFLSFFKKKKKKKKAHGGNAAVS